MKDEFLDYIEDIINAMDAALGFIKSIKFTDFVKDRKLGNYANSF